MEPESSSPYPQVTTIRPYPEPTPSSPHDPLQLPEDTSEYYPPINVLDSPMASFPQASPPTPCAPLYPPPYAPQIAYHVGDKYSVIFPQLSASYQTRAAQWLSRLLLAFNYTKIFSSASHPEIFCFLMNNACKWLMFFNGFCTLHCDTIIQHTQNFSVSHFETPYCISWITFNFIFFDLYSHVLETIL